MRPWAILGWLAAGLLILGAFGLLFENWRGERAWEEYLAKAKAAGEPTTAAELLPKDVPDEENFALIPLLRPLSDYHRAPAKPDEIVGQVVWHDPKATEAARKLAPFPAAMGGVWRSAWQKGELTDLAPPEKELASARAKGEPPLPAGPPGTAMLAHLAKFDPAIKQLREGAKRPRARFARDYDAGIFTEMAYLLPMLDFAKILSARAYSELALGRPQAAADDIVLHVRIGNLLHEEPMALAFLVRTGVTNLAIGPIWEGLARRSWDDPQLVAIESELSQCDALAGARYGLLSERVLGAWPANDALRRNPGAFGQVALSGGDPTLSRLLLPLIPAGWFDLTKANEGEYLGSLAGTVDLKRRRVDLTAAQRLQREFSARFDWRRTLSPEWLRLNFNLQGLTAGAAELQARVVLARCAIAVERYRLAHGEYPAKLADVTPEFLTPPPDPVSGEPVRYRREADGTFTLYLISGNLRDDGGTASGSGVGKIDFFTGDIVWPRLKP